MIIEGGGWQVSLRLTLALSYGTFLIQYDTFELLFFEILRDWQLFEMWDLHFHCLLVIEIAKCFSLRNRYFIFIIWYDEISIFILRYYEIRSTLLFTPSPHTHMIVLLLLLCVTHAYDTFFCYCCIRGQDYY